MVRYLPYNPSSTVRVEETGTIRSGQFSLRHIPKKGSVVIDGFLEVDSLIPLENQFSCNYALDSLYRDANRVLHFSRAHDGQTVTVSYIAIGTVFTADDANEIKDHLESPHDLKTMNESIKGGAKQGSGLAVENEFLNVDLRRAVEHPVNQIVLNAADISDWTQVPDTPYAFYHWQEGSSGSGGGIILPAFDDTFKLLSGNQLLTFGTDYFIYDKDEDTPAWISIPEETFTNKISGGQVIMRWGEVETSIGRIYLGTCLALGGDTLNVALGTTPLTLEGSMWLNVP